VKYKAVQRVFSPVKQWSWLFIPVIAFGGLFWHRLGLLLIPMMLALLIMGLLKGKYWCGNVCPHASLFDGILLNRAPLKRFPALLRNRFFRFGFFVFYMLMFSQRIASAVEYWGTLDFLDRLGFVFSLNYLVPTTVGIVLAFSYNPRAWCTVCPMGVMQELVYGVGRKLGINKATDRLVTISDSEACRHCGRCSQVCPMQLEPHKAFDSEGKYASAACIRCGVCVKNCPFDLLRID